MNSREKFFFRIQYLLGRLFIFIAAPAVTLVIRLFGYTINDLADMRRTIGACLKKHDGPWLICANHLTMIDSIIITYVMFPLYRYALQYRLMPWNIPEKVNLYQIHPIVVMLCHLLKCLPVVRGGNRDTMDTSIAKCTYILNLGENLIIFPEGKRSRNGRIDTQDFPYGVGRFAHLVPNCRVLCIYLRGDHQEAYSDFPRFKENFSVAVDDFMPATELRGLKAQREYARQIIETLSEMEKTYFGSRGQRYC